jgi:hypothetical protein
MALALAVKFVALLGRLVQKISGFITAAAVTAFLSFEQSALISL